jgi:rare lipoprotein A (peptidoglycan hydrolase)
MRSKLLLIAALGTAVVLASPGWAMEVDILEAPAAVQAAEPPAPVAETPALDSVPASGADMLRKGEVGVASFYGKEFKGRKTASGHYFDPEGMTAAHRNLPLGTQVRITNLNNGRSYEALINDRGPFVPGRIIDVSRGLAEKLGFIRSGIAKVKIEVMGWEPLKSLRAAVVAMESPPRRGKTTLARRDD